MQRREDGRFVPGEQDLINRDGLLSGLTNLMNGSSQLEEVVRDNGFLEASNKVLWALSTWLKVRFVSGEAFNSKEFKQNVRVPIRDHVARQIYGEEFETMREQRLIDWSRV